MAAGKQLVFSFTGKFESRDSQIIARAMRKTSVSAANLGIWTEKDKTTVVHIEDTHYATVFLAPRKAICLT